MQTLNLANLLLFDWDVTWGTFAHGGVDKVTPKIAYTRKPKKVGSVGDVELGAWIVGLSAAITVEHREIAKTFYQKIIPWNAGNTDTASVPLFPSTLNADEYAYAAALILHPSHLLAADTTQDFTFPKAYPHLMPSEADGENPNKCIVEYTLFPDRTQLPVLVYGWQGPAV